jgi:hypothetical protein
VDKAPKFKFAQRFFFELLASGSLNGDGKERTSYLFQETIGYV